MSGDVKVSAQYQEHLLCALYDMYEQQQHCDLEIRLNHGESLYAHKAIMMAASTYLRALLENSLASSSDTCVVNIGVSMEEMSDMVRFMYTGKLRLTPESIVPMLACASLLQVPQAIELCQDYLDTALDGLQGDAPQKQEETITASKCLRRNEFGEVFPKDLPLRSIKQEAITATEVVRPHEYPVKQEVLDSPVAEDDFYSDLYSLKTAQIVITPLDTTNTSIKIKEPNKLAETTIKRGRGRPRKYPRPETKIKAEPKMPKTKVETKGTKRKRTELEKLGYQRRDFDAQDGAPFVKKKRGRPCKRDILSGAVKNHSSRYQPKISIAEKIAKWYAQLLKGKMKPRKPYKCQDCRLRYRSSVLLKHHRLKLHTNNKQVKCMQQHCALKIVEYSRVTANIPEPVPFRSYSVQDSNAVCNGESVHAVAMGSDTKAFSCGICQKACSAKKAYFSHYRKKHAFMFKCSRCQKSFPSWRLLSLHKQLSKHVGNQANSGQSETRQKRHKCLHCSRPFVHLHNLKNHLAQLMREKRARRSGSRSPSKLYLPNGWVCEEASCNHKGRFPSSKQLRLHMAQEHPDVLYVCTHNKCKYNTRLKALFNKHVQAHKNNADNMCEVCGKCFHKVQQLRLHRFNKHKLKDPCLKVYKCNHTGCNYVCAFKEGLKQHMGRHNNDKPYTCDICGKSLKTAKTLEKHVSRIHMGVKPYICDKCGLAYTEEAELKIHYVRHNEVKAYQCSMCEYSAHDKGNFQSHLFARHKVKFEEHMQIQSCTICNFTTNVKSRFSDHMRMHLNLRDMPCPECGKMFVTRKTLHSHIVKVHRPKSFKCSECSYAAGVPNKLKEHMKLVHTHRHFKPYKCAYCKFLCASGGNCRKHIMRKHPGQDVKYIKLTEEEFNRVAREEDHEERYHHTRGRNDTKQSRVVEADTSLMHVVDLSALGVPATQLHITSDDLNHGHQARPQQQPQQAAIVTATSMGLPGCQYSSVLATAAPTSLYGLQHDQQQQHKPKLYSGTL